MKRRSAKTMNTDTCVVNLDNPSVKCEEEVHNEEEIIKQYKKNPDLITNPLLMVIKYLLIIIVFLPWIIQIMSKVKQNDIIPKLQTFMEDSFLCPIQQLNNTCVCIDEKKSPIPSL